MEATEPTIEEYDDEPGEDAGSDDELSEVRDILFGSQARNFSRKLDRLEQKISQESRSNREDFTNRLDDLEQFLNDEISALSDRLKQEQKSRSKAITEVVGEMRDLARVFDKRCEELDDQWENSEREIRSEVSEQSKDLGKKMRDLARKLEKETRVLHDDKADRRTLSSILGELATKLGTSGDDK